MSSVGFLKVLPKQLLDSEDESLDSAESYWSQFRGKTFEQFWDMIGRPAKEGTTGEIYPYEQKVLEALKTHRYLWIKKATGLGMSEFFLRWIAWKAVTTSEWKGAQVCIVTGPRIELAVTLINRIKSFFSEYRFRSKETVVELNGCRIEAYPSHHLDTARGLPNVKVFLLDEGDFFPPGEQLDARDVSERYIAKSNPYIFMVSTPNLPGGLFEIIEKEQNCLYERIFLPYTVGMGYVYTEKDIEQAKRSPSFEREYNLKYGQGIGDIFPYQVVDKCMIDYPLEYRSGKLVIAIDPGFGSSKFAIVVAERRGDGLTYILEATQYERPLPSAMAETIERMYSEKYRKMATIVIDSSGASMKNELSARGLPYHEVEFNKKLGQMTIDAASAVKEQKVRIHTAYNELAYQLKAVKFNEKGHPDKKELNFDLGDAFLMAVDALKASDYTIYALKG